MCNLLIDNLLINTRVDENVEGTCFSTNKLLFFFLFSRTQKLIEINFTHLIAEACAEVVVEIPLGYNSTL